MTERERHSPQEPSRRRHRRKFGGVAHFPALAAELAEIARSFYDRGWALGTSGNFSAVVSVEPLRLAITPTGLDKGALIPTHILEIDEAARVVRGKGHPSSESTIHLAIVHVRRVGAVLHTHSVWSTLVSDAFASDGGVSLKGFEMLKGLEGVHTHEHREWLPILENCQDAPRLAQTIEAALNQNPTAHGLLLRRHGLYAWGQSVAEAKRHVEIFEFMLEVTGRTHNARC